MSKPCKNCGELLFWHHKWPYEIHSKIAYYDGCQGLVIDRYTHEILFADLIKVKPKYVTPRHLCANYDKVLKRVDKKIFDKAMETLF